MSRRYSSCFSFRSPNIRSSEHLGEADDRVQRRPKLMGHVGQELGLVPARRLQLLALVLDLAVKAGVLDGQGRLGGEGLKQRERSAGN